MQKRLRNFEHEILSFEHNLFNLGMHNSGRYCGFDTLVPVGSAPTLTFNLTHVESGITYKDVTNAIKGPVGVLLTPQGTIIMEDAAVGNFTIDTNAGNTETRYDMVVCTHSQVQNSGGQDGVYTIIKGPLSSPILPILLDALKQTIVGVLEIPAGAADISDCTWRKMKSPDSGDGEDARLHEVNIFDKFQGYKTSETLYSNYAQFSVNSGITALLWELNEDGNSFVINPDTDMTLDGIRLKGISLQNGLKISLIINEHVIIRETHLFYSGWGPKGYRPIKFWPSQGNTVVLTESNLVGIKPKVGETWVVELQLHDNNWLVTNVAGIKDNDLAWSSSDSTTGSSVNDVGGGTLDELKRDWIKQGKVVTMSIQALVKTTALNSGGFGVNVLLPHAPKGNGRVFRSVLHVVRLSSADEPYSAAITITSLVSSTHALILTYINAPANSTGYFITGQISYGVD